MADEIRAGGAGRAGRTSRTAGGKGPRRTAKARTNRIRGLKMVDTIPRPMEREFEDGESRALDRLAGNNYAESFSGETFAEDLEKAHAFLTEMAAEALPGTTPAGLREDCERLLLEELQRARFVALARKAGAKQ